MRTLTMLVLVVLMGSLALGATGCCCGLPCGDLGGLLGATTMATSAGDYADIPPYPGSHRLSEVAIPALVKTLVEGMSGGKFDVKGYGTNDAPDKVVAFYDQTMPTKGWETNSGTGSSTGSSTGQFAQYMKGDDTLAMIFVDKDTKTGETAIIIMRMVIPITKTP